jgi:hypothetical protein
MVHGLQAQAVIRPDSHGQKQTCDDLPDDSRAIIRYAFHNQAQLELAKNSWVGAKV